MKDSGGISFAAELFHVSVPSLGEPEHLIGICQEGSDRALTQGQDQRLSRKQCSVDLGG